MEIFVGWNRKRSHHGSHLLAAKRYMAGMLYLFILCLFLFMKTIIVSYLKCFRIIYIDILYLIYYFWNIISLNVDLFFNKIINLNPRELHGLLWSMEEDGRLFTTSRRISIVHCWCHQCQTRPEITLSTQCQIFNTKLITTWKCRFGRGPEGTSLPSCWTLRWNDVPLLLNN